MSALAALLAGLAVFLGIDGRLYGPSALRRLRRRSVRPPVAVPRGGVRLLLCGAVAAGLAVAAAALDAGATVGLAAGLAVVAAVGRLRRRARSRADAAAVRARVIEACAVLAADLRAGRPPVDALAGAAEVCAELTPAVVAARLGGDVAESLALAARAPGTGGLRALGAAWRVADQSGAAFAGLTERVAAALRADETVGRQVAAGLAGARATGRVMAGLPVLGILLGQLVGARPLVFLTGGPVGWSCLALGLALAIAGLAWVDRLADSCASPVLEAA